MRRRQTNRQGLSGEGRDSAAARLRCVEKFDAARADQDGALVLLADQDRSRWDRGRMAEGRSLVETALTQRRPGPYQLQAAIAACHADAATGSGTDWRQIAALYGELLRFDPSPVIEANRAVAVAYAEGPAAGLAILDTLAASSRLARWPQLHIARAALLAPVRPPRGCRRRNTARLSRSSPPRRSAGTSPARSPP